MKKQFKKGDKVKVMDQGLLMLQKFAPKGAKPNNEGTVEVEFQLEGENHSQNAPYPPHLIFPI